MRVSVIQMSPSQDKGENIREARRLIEAAVASDRTELVSLPEVWTCLGGTRETKFAQAEPLPAPGFRRTGRPGLWLPARDRADGTACTCMAARSSSGTASVCSTRPSCSIRPDTRSRATARSTCSTS